MKTFKEFQTESYSRLDEGLVTNLLGRGLGAYYGTELYNTVGKDLASGDPKRKVKSGNTIGQVASGIVGGLGDKIVKGGWKYGVKPAWNRVAKPALTGAYKVGKFGLTTAVPWALKQVFGGGVDKI